MSFYSDGKSVPDKWPEPASRYDIRAEVAKREARLKLLSLANVVITKADDAFLASVGITWGDER